MDPDACWKLVSDSTLPLEERGAAAMDLLVWYALDGCYRSALARAFRVDTCKTIICQVLDRLEDLTTDLK